MNPILRRAFINTWALKLAKAALQSREQAQTMRQDIRQRYGAEALDVIDGEWPFVMLALIETRRAK